MLTWSYATTAPPVPIDAAQVQDGTQGLRRSGIVRLPVPASWNSGAGVRTLRLSTSQATFAAPPRLQQLQVNVAAARHRQDFSHGPDTGRPGRARSADGCRSPASTWTCRARRAACWMRR